MNRHILRFVIILAVGIAAGLAHGMVKGMKMPPEVPKGIPKAAVRLAPEATATPVADEPAESAAPTPIPTPAPAPAADLDPELVELKAHFDSGMAVFIDARKREDYDAGHISGAIYGPFEDFIDSIPDWFNAMPLDQMVFVYCDGGDCHASQAVASKMIEYGMENVYVFEQGFPAWQAAGYPVTAGEAP